MSDEHSDGEASASTVHGPRLLVGDVGGTKTDLAVYAVATGPRSPIITARYPSMQFGSLAALARAFLAAHELEVDFACFDVAGPVAGGHVKLTNLPWELDETELAAELGVRRCWLLNDLLAIASAVPYLVEDDLLSVRGGTTVSGGTVGVIAPGTGLGEAFLTWDGNRYHAYPSEGGHTTFGPVDDVQAELGNWMRSRFDHVSYERVCSGIAFPSIYSFFRDAKGIAESPKVAALLAATASHEQARVILDAALDPQSPDALSSATLDMFVSILGAETANLMLKVLSTGGIYMAGGIALRLAPLLRAEKWMGGAAEAGRLSELIAAVPVHVVSNPQVALIGAAGYGIEQVRHNQPLLHGSS